MNNVRKIAIIGVGPRGGYALENLINEFSAQNCLTNIHITLFEATGKFGNGQVWSKEQNLSNWININERILELEKRNAISTEAVAIDSFPSYHGWADKDFESRSADEIDTYPPRAHLGRYLSERFHSLVQPLSESGFTSLKVEDVKQVIFLKNEKLQIISDIDTYSNFDEILLTIGHQKTKLSEQMLKWQEFASGKDGIHLFKFAYPVSNYLNHKDLSPKSAIGIRGFGLSTIDVIRAVADKFGKFTIIDDHTRSCVYESDENMKNMFVPFSLDGLPPVPKPLNARVDNWFKPSQDALSKFESLIGDASIHKAAKSAQFLKAAFAPIAASVYISLLKNNNSENLPQNEIEKLVIKWLDDQSAEHPVFSSHDQSAYRSMEEFVGMAIGDRKISLDFCIGQVWRHCHPSIYSALSYNDCSDDVIAEIIALDESTKRYSYGPPIDSITQLLALVDEGILNLNMVNDPDIELTEEGWRIHTSAHSVTTQFMIDSVLDPPAIKVVKSPIVQNLLEDDLIQVVHNDLGVETDECGYLISGIKDKKIPIALLGRLAKGTIIGVDAIREVFGSRSKDWARQAAKNQLGWMGDRSERRVW